jgi:hypothetical protein
VVDQPVDHGGSHDGVSEHLTQRPNGLLEVTLTLSLPAQPFHRQTTRPCLVQQCLAQSKRAGRIAILTPNAHEARTLGDFRH